MSGLLFFGFRCWLFVVTLMHIDHGTEMMIPPLGRFTVFEAKRVLAVTTSCSAYFSVCNDFQQAVSVPLNQHVLCVEYVERVRLFLRFLSEDEYTLPVYAEVARCPLRFPLLLAQPFHRPIADNNCVMVTAERSRRPCKRACFPHSLLVRVHGE